MGERDLRKYPYPYEGHPYGIPRVRAGFLDWNSEGMEGHLRLGIHRHWGGGGGGGEALDLGFLSFRGQTGGVFLENANFVDFVH